MEIYQAIILGIVQGITEWLPVSSSGHLVLVQNLFGISQPVIFNVLLHIGSLIVVVSVFFKEIIELFKGIFSGKKESMQYLLYLVIASVPIGLVGYFLNDLIKSVFNNNLTVGIGLIFTAIILFLSKYPKKKEQQFTVRSSLITGVGQAFAILPGVSRSGTTISAGLMQGVKRDKVATFAFLLFIPAIIGAALFEAKSIATIPNLLPLIIGLIVTIIVGFFSLKLLLHIIKKNKFQYFSIYCFFVGLIILLFSI